MLELKRTYEVVAKLRIKEDINIMRKIQNGLKEMIV